MRVKEAFVLAAAGAVLAGLCVAAYKLTKALPQTDVRYRPIRGSKLIGIPKVHDGDTVRIAHANGRYYSVRIFGIDAPELRQTCMRGKKIIKCGELSREYLKTIIGTSHLECDVRGSDKRRRVVATCFANGKDIAKEMARGGLAVDYKEYSKGRYAADEEQARAEKSGLWAMRFENPTRWRQCNLPSYNSIKPHDCTLIR